MSDAATIAYLREWRRRKHADAKETNQLLRKWCVELLNVNPDAVIAAAKTRGESDVSHAP